MEDLKRFDIAGYGDLLMVVVESDFIPPEPVIVVIPLLRDYPAVTHLNPTLNCDGHNMILATRLITSAQRSALRRIGSAAGQTDEITRAIDVLLTGF